MKTLSHPNIVNLIEFNESIDYVKRDGRKVKVVAIAMELAQGGELFEYVADSGRFSESTARFYFKQIIETLNEAENLLFDDKFNVKIADFGFSTLIAGKDGSYELKTVLGTESYMAPEIHARKPYSGAAVDLFATGIILFILISGTPPFAKADPKDPHFRIMCMNRWDVFWTAHEKSKPIKPFYSDDFKDLMQKMFALEPKDRLDIEGIKAHPWYSGTTDDLSTIQADFKKRKAIVDAEIKKQKEQREKEKQKKAQVGTGAFGGFRAYRDGEIEKDIESQIKELKITFDPEVKRELKQFEGDVINPKTQLMVVLQPDVLLKKLLVLSNDVFTDYSLGQDNYKIKGRIADETENMEFTINVMGVDQDVQCVEFKKQQGDALSFYKLIEAKFITPLKTATGTAQEQETA
eukprot:CAMPEP_0176465988 /NCGR_PEP_ID=MMETSP0127-20121128/37619_1 /TAXON_ID=938130 /ORGANISM="Platyophrya macrostoma, Strain WH" /LENGTH=406 /DNA_ID=CAMNT_0017859059 /DNA_START=31 /DNA_END=1252 /DNA_ORIENTATION=-